MNATLSALVALVGSPSLFGHLALGTAIGLVAGLMPGVSGRSAMLICLPFVLSMPAIDAAVLLIALHAVSHSTGPIAAILFGAPTSSAEAATALDGFPLARRGEGDRAIGAVLASSALGGLIGAAVLFGFAPAASRLALMIGTPETAALATIGILAIATVSSSGLLIGVAVGALGLLASTVGMDAMTGVPRFAFGRLELWDGISPAAVVAGVIAVPELLARVDDERPRRAGPGADWRGVLDGCLDPLRRLGLVVRAAAIGIGTGLIPGIGTSVAVWVAYGHAAQSGGSNAPFGQGAIEGVIAPEAANGGKEGGALVPTLYFGIPGSSAMAILLGAFAMIGIEVGPRMVLKHPDFPATVAWTLVLANLLALVACVALAPLMIRVAALRRSHVVPFALAASVVAAYASAPSIATLLQIALFSLIGVALMLAGAARPPLLLGFVVGPILESALLRSSVLHGWSSFTRPGVVVIGLVLAALIVAAALRRRRGAARPTPLHRAIRPVLAGLMLVFAAAGVAGSQFAGTAGIVPLAVSVLGFCAAGAGLVGASGRAPLLPTGWRRRLHAGLGLLLAAAIALTGWTGPAVAFAGFIVATMLLAWRARPIPPASAAPAESPGAAD